MTVTFREPKERAKAFSIFGAIGGSGAAIGLLLGGALTQWASWRWCLFINLFFAGVALVGVALFVERRASANTTPTSTSSGTVLGSAGLFFVVYGLGHAVTTSWGNVVDLGEPGRRRRPARGVRRLAAAFEVSRCCRLRLLTQSHARRIAGRALHHEHRHLRHLAVPRLLPAEHARLLTASHRRRLLAAGGRASRSRRSSRVRDCSPWSDRARWCRSGCCSRMMGMILFTKLTPHADYLGHVLPGLVVTGLGLGLIFAPAIASATAGIEPRDAGAASALVNTTQQIGGSMGTALLNTIAVSVTARADRVPVAAREHHSRGRLPERRDHATLHGYAVAFWWAAVFFGAGAILTFGLLESGVPEHEDANVEVTAVD